MEKGKAKNDGEPRPGFDLTAIQDKVDVCAGTGRKKAPTMQFKRLTLNGWQQFASVDLAFHPRLTILTGANATGKSTLLRIVARHFNWNLICVRTPVPVAGGFRYSVLEFDPAEPEESRQTDRIGRIEFPCGPDSLIQVWPYDAQPVYEPRIDPLRSVPGLFIPSHRVPFHWHKVEALNLGRQSWLNVGFDNVQNELRNQNANGKSSNETNFLIKQALLGLILFGHGNPMIPGDAEALKDFRDIEQIFQQVFPQSLGFRSLAIRDQTEVVLETATGDFLLDASSGGLSALIELTWQIFTYSRVNRGPFCVVIDEPENHLHASMQRTLLPGFLKAFPEVQFIVGTHSPLVIGSVQDSSVYVLHYGDDRKVRSVLLDLEDRSGTASEVLHDVLGLDVTMPVWAEERIKLLVDTYVGRGLTKETAAEFRREMTRAGLERWIPEALIEFAERMEVNDSPQEGPLSSNT